MIIRYSLELICGCLAHHRSVKLIQTLPLLLSAFHDINLLVDQRPLRLDTSHDGLGGIT